MSLATPLGLLALVGIALLIIIYLLKPNYQQKVISTTYVWRVSLRYKRKKLPISKFRNIILLICQLLLITICAFLLTQPFIPAETDETRAEKIVIIDASASMLAVDGNGETRFSRAVSGTRELAETVFKENGGTISVILAGETPQVIVNRAKSDSLHDVNAALDELVVENGSACTYGVVDIDGAVKAAEEYLVDAPDAEVVLFTDTTYIDAGGITVRKISGATEWNAAVLNCAAILEENQYTIEIQVASYGRASELHVFCELTGVNEEGRTVSINDYVECTDDRTITLRIVPPDKPDDEITVGDDVKEIKSEMAIYSYDTIRVYLENVHDSFSYDNEFYLFGGKKPQLRVQYTSSNANPFFSATLMAQRNLLAKQWDLDFVEVKDGKPEMEGFDFYIFEHAMPATMPTDGIVMLVSPENAMPSGSGITMTGRRVQGAEMFLERGQRHPITDYIPLINFGVSEYRKLAVADGYEELLYCNGDPVLLCRNEEAFKCIVMLFSVNTSHAPVLVDFPMMMGNIFEYLMPAAIKGEIFDVGDSATIKARGTSVTMTAVGTASNVNVTYTQFPQTTKFILPGAYTLTQPILGNETSYVKRLVNKFFVRIPNAESNTSAVVDSLETVTRPKAEQKIDIDLAFYIAIALVALLIAERLLQSGDRY